MNGGATGTLSVDVEHLGLARGAAKDYYYNEAWQVLETRLGRPLRRKKPGPRPKDEAKG